MDWINRFQQGGRVNQLAQVILQLFQAATKGNQEAAQQLMELAMVGAQTVQLQGTEVAKCGAKLKKKEEGGTVAAKCGKKLALGSKLPKAGCGCKTAQLKRVGGKLVTVDCNGNIVK